MHRLIALIFTIAGLFAGGAFIFFGYRGYIAEREWNPIKAEIVEIEEYWERVSGKNKKRHNVYIDYTYAGDNYYSVKFSEYHSDYRIGDTITIYINPENPNDMSAGASPIFFIIGIIFIIVFPTVGLLVMFAKPRMVEHTEEDYYY